MAENDLPSHFIDLVHDAVLKSFWRKTSLLSFLRRHKISENFLATWQETETKRVFLGRLLPKLEAHAKGSLIIRQMAASLADQAKFPDLEGWEDTPQKLEAAAASVRSLRQYIESQAKKREDTKEREETKKVARERLQQTIAKRETLETLTRRLADLSKRLGTQAAGYEFQDWFYDVVGFFEITHRPPYVTGGRQIDGSLTIEGTTYLTELKFTADQADAPSVDSFLAKVNDKADNTMGIMVSMSGFSSTAIQQASGRKTPIILMDYSHVYLVLGGTWTLPEVVARLRRHASQTGQAFLAAKDFGS
jgi:hypothetical protein